MSASGRQFSEISQPRTRSGSSPHRQQVLAALVCLLAVELLAGRPDSRADDSPRATTQDKSKSSLADRRFAFMQERIDLARFTSNDPKFPTVIVSKPLFRYSDPSRQVISAGVWKLGDTGRPKALIATELYRDRRGKPCFSVEYSSLTDQPFEMDWSEMRWSPSTTDYDFVPLPGATPPESTAAKRSIQLREQARRFQASEINEGERCELRLLSQPIDRYVPSNADHADGAIFVYAYGTNPELVLFIESADGRTWQYAVGRMTGAEDVSATLDGTTVWTGPPLGKKPTSPFIGSESFPKIPGIADDGSDLPE